MYQDDFFADLSGIKTPPPKGPNNDGPKDFEPLPKGSYTIALTEWTPQTTKDGTGKYLKCTFTVTEGEYAKRKLWHNFNTLNKSDKAMEIGLESLKQFLLAASGKAESATTETMNATMGIPVEAWVSQREEIYNGATTVKNTISNFRGTLVQPF